MYEGISKIEGFATAGESKTSKLNAATTASIQHEAHNSNMTYDAHFKRVLLRPSQPDM